MNEVQKKIMEAIKGLLIPNDKEYDAHMVTAWYNEFHDEEVSVRMIAQHLDGCPLPRRRLDSSQEWEWFKQTGNRAWYLYQNRQTGQFAYQGSKEDYMSRRAREMKYYERAAQKAEDYIRESEAKRKSGEWY